MTLPTNFSDAEHFQDVVKRVGNKIVREWFSDIEDLPLGIDNGRQSLRQACLHNERDSLILTVGRMLLFTQLIAAKETPTADTTDRSAHVIRRGKPKITLFFLEDWEDVEGGYTPVTGTIGFRLMSQTAESLSRSEATSYGNKIKTAFGSGNGFVWRKGKLMCSYSDWEKGYQLQLLCRDKGEGKRVVEQVLDLQGHTPDWKFFAATENEDPSQAFPTVPPTDTLLGRSQRLPRRRPIADVRFQYGVVTVPGLPNQVCLYDRSGSYREPLVS